MSLSNEILAFHMPRWRELPDLELYMDQVVSVVERSLEPLMRTEESKSMTPTMINNYVKQQLLCAPVNKKYGRTHLCSLLMIGILKRFMSLSEIDAAMRLLQHGRSQQEVYELFCTALEEELHVVFGGASQHDFEEEEDDIRLLYAMTCAYANLLYSRIIYAETISAAQEIAEGLTQKDKKEKKPKKKEEKDGRDAKT